MKNVNQLFSFTVFVITFVSGKSPEGECDKLTLVTRKEWRARLTPPLIQMYLPIGTVIIAHTATNVSNCQNLEACKRTVEAIQTYHIEDMGWQDIGYNFLIGGDGRVYEGVGWLAEGTHTLGFNRNSVGLGFVGNYTEVVPSQIMIDAALNLIACGKEKGMLTPVCEINGHRDVTCTESPGNKLYGIIRQWKNYKGGRITGYTCKYRLS